jgi:EmrB/QacA subfamily drug resistance transporter
MSSLPAGAPGEPYARRWWALGVLSLGLVLIGLDNTILNVALPTLVRELGATNSQLQWIVDSYVLVFAGMLLAAGSLGDRFGRKGALNFGLIVFVGAAIYCATTDSAEQLIVGRAVMGLGGAFIMPSTLSILTNMFPPNERARAIGIWAGMAGVGIPLGPLVGGWLLENADWGWVFLINVPIVAVALGLGMWLLPTSRDPAAPRIDIPGAALSMVGLGAVIYGLIEAPNHGWTAPETLLVFAAGAAVLALFVVWERRTREPMLDLRFFRNPRFTAANIAVTLVFFALLGSMFSMTQYLQFVLGYSALEAGIRMMPMALGMMIGAPLSARLVEHVGSKVVVTAGLTLVAVGLALLSRLDVDSGYPQLLASLGVMAFGMGLTMAPSTEAIMGAIPRSKAGVGSAMNDTTRQVGGALGIAVIGSLMSSTYSSNVADVLRGLGPEVIARGRGSVGAALQIASQSGAEGAAIAEGAKLAFVDAMTTGLLAGSAVALLGALVALIWLPATGTDAGETFDDAEARGLLNHEAHATSAVRGGDAAT